MSGTRSSTPKWPPLPNRAESDSLIFDKDQRSNYSPSSLRRELLQGKLSKEISQEDPETGVGKGSQLVSEDNTYLDLIGDKNADPVHIPDSDHRRRSFDSTSLNSDEGIIMQQSMTSAPNGINECSESYIDDSEISTYGEKKVDKNFTNICQDFV